MLAAGPGGGLILGPAAPVLATGVFCSCSFFCDAFLASFVSSFKESFSDFIFSGIFC